MPWLEKDEVLFIHVPRCGGTSITKHHKVGQKAQKGKNLYYRLGLKYYYYRYKILETANFPLLTIENLIAVCQFTLAWILFFPLGHLPVPYVMMVTSTTLFLNSTFVWTAPVLMRITVLRYLFMYFQDVVLCGIGCDTEYLVGTNRNGYLFHLTAERCIRYGYVSETEMKKKSFSIIRNPYSRAVSMYAYNKRLCESFEHFIKDFHKTYKNQYEKHGRTDSKYIYCHVLPMHAYTHINGKQVVNTIIKQEHLKRLLATNWKDSGVPEKISQALTGIPHANRRKKKAPWQEYYTQETMDLVLEMYEKDFDIFGYDKFIPERPDLSPKITTNEEISQPTTHATNVGTLLRQSVSVQEGESSSHLLQSHEDLDRLEAGKNILPEEHLRPQKSKSGRSVSISERVDTKEFTPFSAEKFSASSYRRTTSAGEETSEVGSPSFGGSSKSLIKHNSNSAFDASLVRKKRSASAFVLHVA